MPSDSGSEEYPRAPAQKARDENILGVFEATEDPVLTTSEVAEELPIGKRATLNRLEDLVDRGELDSKDVGVGRVWWKGADEPVPPAAETAAPDPEPTPAPEPDAPPETAPALDRHRDAPAQDPAATAREGSAEPLESESPRWAFIGSLGRHSILAGVFMFALLVIEEISNPSLLPISILPVFLTGVVFFLIGFPARGAYRTKKYFESTELSLSQFVGPLGRIFGQDDSRS